MNKTENEIDVFSMGRGTIISIDTFGASAPGYTVIREYGFTVERVVSVFDTLYDQLEPFRRAFQTKSN